MSTYEGTCRVTTTAGDTVFDDACVWMTDESTVQAYTSRPPWYGDLFQDGADLLQEQTRTGQECVLEFDGSIAARARIMSVDMVSQRVQFVGLGPWPV
jgi:hypothetical protein